MLSPNGMLAARNHLLLRRIPSHGLSISAIVSTTMGGTTPESNRLSRVWIPCPRGTRGIPMPYTSRQDYCKLFRQITSESITPRGLHFLHFMIGIQLGRSLSRLQGWAAISTGSSSWKAPKTFSLHDRRYCQGFLLPTTSRHSSVTLPLILYGVQDGSRRWKSYFEDHRLYVISSLSVLNLGDDLYDIPVCEA